MMASAEERPQALAQRSASSGEKGLGGLGGGIQEPCHLLDGEALQVKEDDGHALGGCQRLERGVQDAAPLGRRQILVGVAFPLGFLAVRQRQQFRLAP